MMLRFPRIAATAVMLSSMLTSTFTVLPAHAQQRPFAPEPFTDVPATHANYDAIEFLRKNNAVRGFLDGTFKPNRRLTRAEFVALLTNPYFLSGQRANDCLKVYFGPESKRVFFHDVRLDSEAAQDICEAVIHGLVSGYPDGTFKPNAYISFVEAAKVITNVLSLDVQKLGANEHWYTPHVRRLAELKAIPRTITRLDKVMTRGEMAEIVYRIKAGVKTKASMSMWEVK